MKRLSLLASFSALLLCIASPAFAKGAAGKVSGATEASEALQVKGQTRNVSMMGVANTKKSSIRFVAARKDYKQQIMTTPY